MESITIILERHPNGFSATNGAQALFSKTLRGFGTHIEGILRERLGENVDVDYVLFDDLRSAFPACPSCEGATTIHDHETCGAQYLETLHGAIDLELTGTRLCSSCRGLGVTIPRFWDGNGEKQGT